MIIIPSLDIQDGKSKYPYQGSYDPITIIKSLKNKGFHHFLLVDLDGVFSGEFVHYDMIQQIKAENVSLFVGGGVRTFEIAEKIIAAGADTLVIGTIAIKDQELLMDLINAYPDRLSVAIDTYDESVFIEGWVEDSDVDISEFVQSMTLLGVKHLIHTEINHTDDANICANQLMQSLSRTYGVHVTPTIDIVNGMPYHKFIECGCKEVILGGALDLIDFHGYFESHV